MTKSFIYFIKLSIFIVFMPIVIIVKAIPLITTMLVSITKCISYLAQKCKSKSKNIYASEKTVTQFQTQLSKIDLMTGYEFEDFIIQLLKRHGYTNVNGTSYSGDYGVDIIANLNGEKYAIQCKRYTGSVGVKAIQEVLSGMHYYKCDRAIVITNSTYSKNAVQMATAVNVELWDRIKLSKLLRKFQPDNDRDKINTANETVESIPPALQQPMVVNKSQTERASPVRKGEDINNDDINEYAKKLINEFGESRIIVIQKLKDKYNIDLNKARDTVDSAYQQIKNEKIKQEKLARWNKPITPIITTKKVVELKEVSNDEESEALFDLIDNWAFDLAEKMLSLGATLSDDKIVQALEIIIDNWQFDLARKVVEKVNYINATDEQLKHLIVECTNNMEYDLAAEISEKKDRCPC